MIQTTGDEHAITRKEGHRNFKREAIAYAVGRTEEWIRRFCEDTGLPMQEITSGVSYALAVTGNRATMSLPEMRTGASIESQVLLPEVAVASSPRKSMQSSKQKTASHKLSKGQIVWMCKAKQRGVSNGVLAKKYGVSPATVTYHVAKRAK